MNAAKQINWLDAAERPSEQATKTTDRAVARERVQEAVLDGVPADAWASRIQADEPAAIALEIAAELGVAQREMTAIAAELSPTWGDELMEMLNESNRRANADLAYLKEIHAKILGITIEDVDARVAADQAKEKAEREARKAARPTPTRTDKTTRSSRSQAREPEALPTQRLSDRERELLKNLRVDGQLAVYLPEEHIPDWALLKDIMISLGGKWKTGGKKAKGGFLFQNDIDAREQVRLALETGEILDPRAAGFFPTPNTLADRIVALAGLDDLKPRDRLLEPSAGRGAIAQAVLRAAPSARVVCVEFLPDNAKALRAAGFDVIEQDFLSLRPDDYEPFDRICANPPFAARADVHHITRMLDWLRPGGRLVAIASAGIAYRDDKLGAAFRSELERHGALIEHNQEGAFAESGTMVRTVTISLTKRSDA